ncbi:MAG: chorismate-binding protein [Flavobacteriaceae bacterium]|nr:chorismate-binding protein [Flavobacteriaceae bacterium]
MVYFGLFADADIYQPYAPLNPSSEAWCLDTEYADFHRDIESIRAQIAAGDVYQINHTLRLRGGVSSPWAHFQSIGLEAPQGAYIETDEFVVASGSPELFFHLDNQQ